MADLYVMDTHVLIWYFIGSKRLKPALKEKIDETRNRNGRLLVPTIVLVEALDIAEKGKVQFDFSEMYRLIREEPEFEIVSFSPEIFKTAIQVRNVPDLHDRIIVATARFYGTGILTKDRLILESGEIQSL
ncbi:MAG: type II toxin-antitoxin system VapC family toxin [candidate division NC10 bacterium]|nr:type II toxin-antitoxin system VapC family toxin [candidate division NC10 bacterium]